MKILSPLKGEIIELSKVPDAIFSKGIMGDGIAIEPSSKKVLAPISGKIVSLFPTNHAVGIESADGVKILIHIGIDTVELKGKYFKSYIKQGQEVEVGNLLLKVNFKAIAKKGYSTVSPIIVIASGKYSVIELEKSKKVKHLDSIISLLK